MTTWATREDEHGAFWISLSSQNTPEDQKLWLRAYRWNDRPSDPPDDVRIDLPQIEPEAPGA